MRFFKYIYCNIKHSPFIKDNSSIANLILLLGIVLFFAVLEDFSTEISLDKNEITNVIQILDSSEEDLFFEDIIVIINQKNFVTFLSIQDVIIEPVELFHIFSNRSPPEVC
ncbi:MAG TPA: hypothetical protein VHP32_05940 [Ignavibacteria bacterium]|nr:hypothetical protein [Ignavibacteria bacterium]